MIPELPHVALGCIGPVGHGVADTARQVAAGMRALGFRGDVRDEPDPGRISELPASLPRRSTHVHLHVNDWLFPTPGGSAQDAVTDVLTRLAADSRTVSLTLHDIPQAADGAALFARRTRTYRRWVDTAAAVAVSSGHERELLREAGIDVGRVAVLPLAVPDPLPASAAPPGAPGNGRRPTVGIFGFLYPGKGHREVIEELAGLDVEVVALGRPSDRHDDLPAELAAAARRAGVGFRCTGFVPTGQVPALLRAVDVPVAPHTHLSASASINSWIRAGRRVLAPDGRYVRELVARMPGVVRTYGPAGLAGRVADALADPAVTRLPADFRPAPTGPQVAAAALDFLAAAAGPT